MHASETPGIEVVLNSSTSVSYIFLMIVVSESRLSDCLSACLLPWLCSFDRLDYERNKVKFKSLLIHH